MQNQIVFDAQRQIAQAEIQNQVDQIRPDSGEREMINKSHESDMMDKKIKLAQIQNKKKKTVAEEAKSLGLTYVGGGKYADSGNVVTHINENGRLLPYINKE